MRNPYVVGRWVRGRGHYGRERLTDYLLYGPDAAVWLVGTRRMGKTSMLRQLELIAGAPGSHLVPVVWDLQGCHTPAELSVELVESLIDVAERLRGHGIEPEEYANQDALVIVRSLSRRLEEQGKQLFLLIDEAEALLNTAQVDPAWVGRLRRVLQDGRVRTVITSTKLLARLNDRMPGWVTSPFLFGFSMVTLPRLEDAAARALVRQTQSDTPVTAADGEVDDVLIHTNGQPYLIQLLCQRIFVTGADGAGHLRPITEDDLAVDHVLGGLFAIDYQHLTRSERRLFLAVVDLTVAKESELLVRLADLAPHRIRTFLYSLERAGMLRRVFDQWAVGNEFLRRWATEHYAVLMQQLPGDDEEPMQERVVESGRRQEIKLLRAEIARLEQQLADVEAALVAARGQETIRYLEEMDRLRREIARLRKELAAIEIDE